MANQQDDVWAERERAAARGEEWHYDPHHGHSLMDDFVGWMPKWSFNIRAFPPTCLTISGAMALAVGLTFLLGAIFNVVVPHFERVAHSVQTRCQIMEMKDDEYIHEELYHFTVKFPLPGIDGLRDGEMLCYGSERCATFLPGTVHDCFFNTEDHSLRFDEALSGHHEIRLASYVILLIPFLCCGFCCLIPASVHWRSQLQQLRREAEGLKDPFMDVFGGEKKRPTTYRDDYVRDPYEDRYQTAGQYDNRYHSQPMQGSYQSQQNAMSSQQGYANQYGSGNGRPYNDPYQQGPYQSRGAEPPADAGTSGVSGVSWLRMQMGV